MVGDHKAPFDNVHSQQPTGCGPLIRLTTTLTIDDFESLCQAAAAMQVEKI